LDSKATQISAYLSIGNKAMGRILLLMPGLEFIST